MARKALVHKTGVAQVKTATPLGKEGNSPPRLYHRCSNCGRAY
jgi:dihydroorotate dehydrogenase